MNMVSNQLNLPLFLVSRNRIKSEHLDQVRNYIKKKRVLYTSRCEKENSTHMVNKKKSKHIAFNLKPQPPCSTQHKFKQSQDNADSWHLSPNLYNVQKIPFSDRKGANGAYWKKPTMHKSIQNTSNLHQLKPHFQFFNLERKSELCLQKKGVFLSNARERRASTRLMINSVQGSYHDPNEPGPEHYFPQNFMLSHNVYPVTKTKRTEPYIYIPNTSVPEKPNSIHPKRRFLCPGPGRYENRYPRISSCNLHRLVFMPCLQLIIDREKRLKFRRLPYTKIKSRQYFSPDWHHVIGHGYRRLFKHSHGSKLVKDDLRETKVVKEPEDKDITDLLKTERKMYPDNRYIYMINNPNRRPISLREKRSYTQRPPTERYNSKQKENVIIRRKIKGSNKRIAFNSCQERFKNSERPLPLTPQQLRKINRSLPLELRMRNYPIMTKQPDEIHPKLTAIPKRMLTSEDLELHKRLFKFSPAPTRKLLVSSNELHIPNAEVYFDRKLDPTLFLRTGHSCGKVC